MGTRYNGNVSKPEGTLRCVVSSAPKVRFKTPASHLNPSPPLPSPLPPCTMPRLRCLAPGRKLAPGHKRLFFIRHGQSLYNLACIDREGVQHSGAAGSVGGPDGTMSMHACDYIDSPLTELGLGQAKELCPKLATRGVELVIGSPLERALQTALGVFPEPPGGMVLAREDVREVMFGPEVSRSGNNSQRFSVSSKRERFGGLVDFSCIEFDDDEPWRACGSVVH